MDTEGRQRIVVFQQNGSGQPKIKGIGQYGGGRFDVQTISIDNALPQILDNTDDYLPKTVHADLVMDFLKHPDLSCDLMEKCLQQGIPVVASGKKNGRNGIHTPPT